MGGGVRLLARLQRGPTSLNLSPDSFLPVRASKETGFCAFDSLAEEEGKDGG